MIRPAFGFTVIAYVCYFKSDAQVDIKLISYL